MLVGACCGLSSEVQYLLAIPSKSSYRQVGRGRPTKDTRYIKQMSTRFHVSYRIDYARIAEDQKSDGLTLASPVGGEGDSCSADPGKLSGRQSRAAARAGFSHVGAGDGLPVTGKSPPRSNGGGGKSTRMSVSRPRRRA